LVHNFSKKITSLKDSGSISDNQELSFSIFGSQQYHRFALLSEPKILICLLLDNDVVPSSQKRSNPFRVDGISIGMGGFQSSKLYWEDLFNSGYFVYKNQTTITEIYVIPEYMLVNCSDVPIIVRESDSYDDKETFTLHPKQRTPMISQSDSGLSLRVELQELSCFSGPVSIEKFGLNTHPFLSESSQKQQGTLFVVSTVGGPSERILIKLGPIEMNDDADMINGPEKNWIYEFLKNDFLKLNLRAEQIQAEFHSEELEHNLFLLLFEDASFLYQRVFLLDSIDADGTNDIVHSGSDTRSRIVIRVRNILVKDIAPNAQFEIVLRRSSPYCDFAIFSLYFQGSLFDRNIAVDLAKFDLLSSNQDAKMHLNVSKEFTLRVFGFICRVLGYVRINSYDRRVVGKLPASKSFQDSGNDANDRDSNSWTRGNHTNSDEKGPISLTENSDLCWKEKSTKYMGSTRRLLEFKQVAVNAFGLDIRLLDSGYQISNDIPEGFGVGIMRHLFDHIELPTVRQEIQFSDYVVRNLQCNPFNLFEMLQAIYFSRLKFKWIKMVDSESSDDWIESSGEDETDHDFVASDLSFFSANEKALPPSDNFHVVAEFQRALEGLENLNKENNDLELTEDDIAAANMQKQSTVFSIFRGSL